MALDLSDYENRARDAVMAFWGNRDKAKQKQMDTGTVDAGERSSVTAGKNMDGFLALILELVKANGLGLADIHIKKSVVVLPGYFRPTKQWDLLVMHQGRLVAAIELKSQVGSFGNNFNNRTEEAVGTAHDFWTAFREGAFGETPPPFLGWLMLVEDAPEARTPVTDRSRHFRVFPEFQGASYIKRYDVLCQRLVQEKLYTAACVIASPRSAVSDGSFQDASQLSGLKSFVTSFAGHIAIEAARL